MLGVVQEKDRLSSGSSSWQRIEKTKLKKSTHTRRQGKLVETRKKGKRRGGATS